MRDSYLSDADVIRSSSGPAIYPSRLIAIYRINFLSKLLRKIKLKFYFAVIDNEIPTSKTIVT